MNKMLKTVVLISCAVVCNGAPFSGILDGISRSGTLENIGYGPDQKYEYDNDIAYSSGGGDYYGEHVKAAIKSHHSVDYYPVHSEYGHSKPTIVDIDTYKSPVLIKFKTRSSPLHADQEHYGEPGSHQDSHSEDEPHLLRHEVTRPVIQEIREIIVPSRKVYQEIKPVIEKMLTRVAKDNHKSYKREDEHLGERLGLSGDGRRAKRTRRVQRRKFNRAYYD